MGEKLNVTEKIVLLENHGLICSGNSFEETFNMSLKINQLCKEWLIRNSKTFKTFRDKFLKNESDCILFLDASYYSWRQSSIKWLYVTYTKWSWVRTKLFNIWWDI